MVGGQNRSRPFTVYIHNGSANEGRQLKNLELFFPYTRQYLIYFMQPAVKQIVIPQSRVMKKNYIIRTNTIQDFF
jgi:hypothetical protein